MVLIDALYICSSGGLRLLIYLIEELNNCDVEYYLLADKRCEGLFIRSPKVEYLEASLLNRKRFYVINKTLFSSVLCFGNIPAPIKLEVPVYTYFHNINLLTLSEAKGIKTKIMSWLKRGVFRHYKNNTDFWLVQTSNTANELINHLKERPERVQLMPFYELPVALESIKNQKHGEDYVFISTYTGSKGHEELLLAWHLLHIRGIDKKLHLTVPLDCHPFVDDIAHAQREGVQVENHGIIPFEGVIDLYKQSKAIVYPSHNESLGLGIIEAISAGCNVISSDLPFTYAICRPSVVFNPWNPNSIVDAIIKYEEGDFRQSELSITSKLSELIALLSRSK